MSPGGKFGFWETQRRPIGIREGITIVDLVLDSNFALVFVEAKLDAPASAGTTGDPDRNQLLSCRHVPRLGALRSRCQLRKHAGRTLVFLVF